MSPEILDDMLPPSFRDPKNATARFFFIHAMRRCIYSSRESACDAWEYFLIGWNSGNEPKPNAILHDEPEPKS